MKKNLLVITPCYPDWEWLVIWDPFVKTQVDSISKYFNQVYIISPRPYWFWFLSKLFDVKPNLKYYSYNNIKVFYPSFFHLPIKYYREKLWDNQFITVDRLIKKNNLKFDIIHSHFTWPCGYIWVKLKEIYHKFLVITWHGTDIRNALKWNNLLMKNKLDYVLKKSDKIHTNHEELYDLLMKNYHKFRNKIIFTYKWINIDKFDKKNKKILKKWKSLISKLWINGKFNVLFIWNLNDFKDPMTFLSTAKLLREHNNFTFLIAWGWYLKEKVEEYVKFNKLSNVKILWERNDTNVLYSISNVFCAMSPYENIWSTTIQEAFCIWIPCIITNAWYTSKILHDKKDCLIVSAENPNETANKILEVYTNFQLVNEITNNLVEWRNRFDSNNLSKENYDKLYKK